MTTGHTEKNEAPKSMPPQKQSKQPGIEHKMTPEPEFMPKFAGANRLHNKIALITGGDSGIGRAVAIAFAREGAHIAIVYLEENEDARKTQALIENEGRKCLSLQGDVGDESFCKECVDKVVEKFGRFDILVNNTAEQHQKESIEEIPTEQLEKTFRTNIFSMFYFVKAAVAHMKSGSTIINTTSVTAYKGNDHLLDYSSTKGAIVAFTRSLSQQLIEKEIRVNAVAPGPIWTPLIPATFDEKHVQEFGKNVPMKRPGQPNEVAPAYVFLASDDASYISGQIIHPNGGVIVNS
ncbi:MAG TPA: SDR family oxidoreductase [Oculatellaceae cyanobacterium]